MIPCILILLALTGQSGAEEESGVELPSECEVCKFVALELTAALTESGRTSSVIETAKGVVKKYRDSELRLLETLESVCDRFQDYNVHKERKGSQRFGRGQSETMRTLHGLVEKGVKVELGIPYELWDEPSVEVAELKRLCEWRLGEWEEVIEQWFHGPQTTPLLQYLCQDRVLSRSDRDCLQEQIPEDKPKGDRGEL